MTFEEFQQLCNQAASTNQQVTAPSPIVIGEENVVYASFGDTPFHYSIIFRTKPDNAALQAIYQSVRFGYDALNNLTVISPLTTGT